MCNLPTKTCVKCKLEKSINQFAPKRRQCKECRQIYRRGRGKIAYEVNKIWLAKQSPDYSAAHRRKQMADPVHRDRLLANKNRWIEENREHVNEKQNENRRRRYLTVPSEKLSRLLRAQFNIAINGMTKNSSVLTLLGCSLDEFRLYIESKFMVGMTWTNRGRGKDKWQLDHILPIALFNLSDEKERQRCWHYTNFQPLWHLDNLTKSDKLPCGKRARDIKEKISWIG